jgi:hypothetical protein
LRDLAAATSWAHDFVILISALEQDDANAGQSVIRRYSDTELIRFSVWLHLAIVRVQTSLNCAIVDEHLAWMFDQEELNKIYNMADRMSLEQILFFQRLPYV